MGNAVAKNGCHAYQVLKTLAHAKSKEGTVHKEECSGRMGAVRDFAHRVDGTQHIGHATHLKYVDNLFWTGHAKSHLL